MTFRTAITVLSVCSLAGAAWWLFRPETNEERRAQAPRRFRFIPFDPSIGINAALRVTHRKDASVRIQRGGFTDPAARE